MLYHFQVCLPGLHITLGIFMRLFVLLEVECNKLDLTMLMQGSGAEFGPSYHKYAAAFNKQTELKDEQLAQKNALKVLVQLFTFCVSSGGVTTATSQPFLQLVAEINKIKDRLEEIVSKVLLSF